MFRTRRALGKRKRENRDSLLERETDTRGLVRAVNGDLVDGGEAIK